MGMSMAWHPNPNPNPNPTHPHPTRTRTRTRTPTQDRVALVDRDLSPEVLDGDGDRLAVEAIARVAHEPHARMCAARDGRGCAGAERGAAPLAVLQPLDARLVLEQTALADELEGGRQLHAV